MGDCQNRRGTYVCSYQTYPVNQDTAVLIDARVPIVPDTSYEPFKLERRARTTARGVATAGRSPILNRRALAADEWGRICEAMIQLVAIVPLIRDSINPYGRL